MSLTQAEKKEEEKERSEVEGRDERKRQTEKREEKKQEKEGIFIHKPLGVSVVTPTTVTSRQVQVLIRILNFY